MFVESQVENGSFRDAWVMVFVPVVAVNMLVTMGCRGLL